MLLKDLEAYKFLYWFMSLKYYLHFSRIYFQRQAMPITGGPRFV